jgi:peptidoglycan/LPS O-acetylase OafA/YrhL
MIPGNPLPSKPRYEILDGLRGVAAAIVLLYHHFEVNGLGLTTSPINHGYLAVDFFFILSGYVVGYAYDDRWNRMSTWTFFKRRLVRLHPMIVLSTLVGLLFFYFGTGDMFPLVGETPVGKLLVVALLGLLMIPVPVSMDVRGWALTAPELTIGFTRLLFPFFAGLLLSRMGWKIRVRGGFLWCSLLLVVLLAMPRVGGEAHGLWNGMYEAACILLFFPVVVLMGAGSVTTGRTAKACKFLGDISYPLYITQYPIVFTLLGGWISNTPDATSSQVLFTSIMSYLFCFAAAYASLKLYDEPVRRWLTAHWLHRKPANGK